jgi:hypothetical protein
MIYGWIYEHSQCTTLPESGSKAELLDQTYMSVLFRAKDDALNGELGARINATSKMFVSGTSWQKSPACRIAISNWRVSEQRDFALVTSVLDKVAM